MTTKGPAWDKRKWWIDLLGQFTIISRARIKQGKAGKDLKLWYSTIICKQYQMIPEILSKMNL